MSTTLDILKRLVGESGRGISEIARDAGINKGMVSKLMNGKVGLSIESAEKLARALGHEVAVLKRTKKRRS